MLVETSPFFPFPQFSFFFRIIPNKRTFGTYLSEKFDFLLFFFASCCFVGYNVPLRWSNRWWRCLPGRDVGLFHETCFFSKRTVRPVSVPPRQANRAALPLMSTAPLFKWFSLPRSKRICRLLSCGVVLVFCFGLVPVFGQEPPRFLRFNSSPERPLLQLTPSGRSLVDPPRTTSPVELMPLRQLEKPLVAPLVGQEELEQIILEGKNLETEGRLAESLAHWEAALRLHRNNDELMKHYRVARFRCDVGRRYSDPSYLNLIRSLTAIETLKFFEEVMSRIQQYYTDTPQWEHLFRHGVQDFNIALIDKNFRIKVGLNVLDEQVGGYLATVQTTTNGWKIRDREDMKNGLLHIVEMAQKQLGLNPVVALMEFTCGVVNSLDPNTGYLTPNQLSDQLASTAGNLVGLGVDLRADRESLLILRVIPGSPAEECGLKGNDRILAVNGISISGKDIHNAADLLQGEAGTTVSLSIRSEGIGQRPREVQITRRKIEVPSVEDVRMINDALGYVKLTGFHEKTGVELAKALNDLDRRGMKCLVLDMRQNPGGLFQAGIEVANMFIEHGAIVRTQCRGLTPDSPYMARGENTRKTPLIVLVDEESASASEIVAGAIRDHKRGTLIGKQTYGKGTIQQIVPVLTGTSGVRSGIKLTVEKFYSPSGWAYSGVGVTPDIVIQNSNKHATAKPWESRLLFPPSPVTSNLDDPFIQEAVKVSQNMVK